jgi:hypothetical protein
VSIGPVLAAGVPALGAVGAAAVAARAARRSKVAELQVSEVLDLERRLSEARQKVFEPMVEALGRLVELTASKKLDEAAVNEQVLPDIFRFAHWVQIYGSDEAVLATVHFMQALWVEAPANVLIRLQGELILAARRELGYRDTRIRPIEGFALRVKDAYTDPAWSADLADPLDVVFARHNWAPPWAEPSPSSARNERSDRASN